MPDPLAMSLVLPYVRGHTKWVMLAVRTSKSLSQFFDVDQRHWDKRYKTLLQKLLSGRARFNIKRYTDCVRRDPWDSSRITGAVAFTISIIEALPRSFARQAVPQMKQILRIVKDWSNGRDIKAIFTAKPFNLSLRARCERMQYAGFIPINTVSTPSELVSGDLEALAISLEPREDGYETSESWECDCGESYSASLGW